MKTILVPTDFSPCARKALDYALALALHTHSRIVLFHAFHRPINIWQAPEVRDIIQEYEETERGRLQKLAGVALQATWVLDNPVGTQPVGPADGAQAVLSPNQWEAGAIPGEEDVEITCLARFGLIEDEIIQAAETTKADLVVMGMRGAGTLSELFLGSTTTAVMRKTPCPVLAIPETANFEPIRKIMFATDFRGLPDATMMQTLLDFKQTFGASLCLVHLYNQAEGLDLDPNAATAAMEHYLGDQDYTLYFVKREDVLEGLLEHLEKTNPQLMAVVPRKHGLLDRLLGVSLTKKLAFRSPIPMLALPGKY